MIKKSGIMVAGSLIGGVIAALFGRRKTASISAAPGGSAPEPNTGPGSK